MLNWRDEYSVGVDFLDNQHKMLFEIGNKAMTILKDNNLSHSYEEIMTIFQELKNYAIFHFKSEEEYMLKINYNMFLTHKSEHDEFVEKLNELHLDETSYKEIEAKDINTNHSSYLQGLLKFIIEWIFNHILASDRLYKIEL